MKLSKGSVPISVKLIENFRKIKKNKSENFPLVSPRTLVQADGLRQLGRLDQVPRSTMSTIEDSTTFSISMCFNSSTMYFQVHGTGILVAVVLAVQE